MGKHEGGGNEGWGGKGCGEGDRRTRGEGVWVHRWDEAKVWKVTRKLKPLTLNTAEHRERFVRPLADEARNHTSHAVDACMKALQSHLPEYEGLRMASRMRLTSSSRWIHAILNE